MNGFDFSILSRFTQFADEHPAFNQVVLLINDSSFLKTGIIVTLCFWAWFAHGEAHEKNRKAREIVIAAMLACFVSIVVARVAVLALPFRIRPLADASNGLHFIPSNSFNWQDWSSFPSDHAIMFLTLSTCLFAVSPVFGGIALAQSLIMVCLPRIYVGIHYPTDVLAGALIGIGIGLLAISEPVRRAVAKLPFSWLQRHPGSFYAGLYLFMYEVTRLFSDIRHVALAVLKH